MGAAAVEVTAVDIWDRGDIMAGLATETRRLGRPSNNGGRREGSLGGRGKQLIERKGSPCKYHRPHLFNYIPPILQQYSKQHLYPKLT